jgi:hypothetical protein
MKKIKFTNFIPQALGILFLVFLAANWHQKPITADIFTEAQSSSYIGQEAVYYGQLKAMSTSGSMKFTFYYPGTGVFDDSRNGWFWANLDFGKEDNIELFKLMIENSEAIFKITGTRNADDTGYYQDGLPVKDIDVKNIEVFKQ